MIGGIYTEENCPICGARMRDNGRTSVACPKHRRQITNHIFVRFGREIKRRFQNYQVASQFLSGLRYETVKGSFDPRDYSAARPLSFTNLSEKYLEQRESELKKSTFCVLKPRIRRAQSYFGDTNVKLIRFAELDDFIRAQEDFASKTKHEMVSMLSTFWKWLVDREEIKPSEMPKFPKIKFSMKRRNTITKEMQHAILSEIERITKSDPKIHLGVLWLATYVNLRPGELRVILESDIDRNQGVIHIRHHKTESSEESKYIVLIDDDLETVRKLRGFPHQHFFRHDRAYPGGIKPGDPFGRGLLYDTWVKACKNLGITGVDLYGGTRHSSAMALREHMSREEVKELTGHHTSASFSRYFWADLDVLKAGYGKARR